MSDEPQTANGEADRPSYFKEMLFSSANINFTLGTLAVSTLLGIPFGLPGFALPLVAFVASESIAALFVPSSPKFRAWVDRRHRRERREAVARQLIEELRRRAGDRHSSWDVYARLLDRAVSLRRTLSTRGSTVISEREAERFDDAAIDYLSLWLAHLGIEARLEALTDADLQSRLADIDRRLARDEGNRSLTKARDDIVELIDRRRRLISRRAAVEAAMISLPDAVEEIAHAALTSTGANDASRRLMEAVDRLRIEEDLEASVEDELGEALPQRVRRLASVQRKQAGRT
jgi:hypothetical protein